MSKYSWGWLMVVTGGLLEMSWLVGMKYSQDFTRWRWVAVMAATMTLSFGLMALATSSRFGLPIGTAYAVWTGMGAAGSVVLGMMLFNEPREFARLFFLILIIVGIVGVKITHRPQAGPSTPAGNTASQDRN